MLLPMSSIANSLVHVVTDIFSENQERNNDVVKESLQNELQRIKHEREIATKLHEQHVHDMRQHLQDIQREMNKIRHNELPVHCYASELKDTNNNITPSYILALQAQVCRAVHHLCVDTTQLKLLERTNDSLNLLSKGQEGVQLDKVLWAVEAKVELQQQEQQVVDVDSHHCVITNKSNTDESPHDSGMDRLLTDNLSKLNGNNPVKVANVSSLDDIPEDDDDEEQECVTNETHEQAREEPNASSSGLDILVGNLSNLKTLVDLQQESSCTSTEVAAQEQQWITNVSNDEAKATLGMDSLVMVSRKPVNPKREEDWEEITMKDLKSKDNLDTLLLDGDEEAFHQSLPTIGESPFEGKKAMGRRGSMIAEGACTGKVAWQ